MMRTIGLVIGVGFGLAAAVPAAAWVPRKVCPGGDEQTWETNTFPATISSLAWFDTPSQDAVAAAIMEWDDGVLGDSALSFTTSVAAAPVLRGDDVNVVAVVDASQTSTDPGFLGTVDIRGRSCWNLNEIIECDVWLNGLAYTWLQPSQVYDFMDQSDFVGNKFMPPTVLHEIGHCLGFDHTGMLADNAQHLATMNPFSGGRDVIGEREFLADRKHYVSEDDRTGMRELYPDSGTATDIAAQSYFYDENADNPWVCGVWARPAPANDLQDDLVPIFCEDDVVNSPPPPLEVFPGTVFTTQFTALNLGTWDQSLVDARIVFTPQDDPNPSTYVVVDTFEIATLASDRPLELERTITVPATLLDSTYYVLLQLDYDDAIAEDDEGNNEAFWNQKVTVVGSPTGCGGCDTTGHDIPWLFLVAPALLHRRRVRR